MKKLLIALMSVAFIGSFVSATYNNTSNEWLSPEYVSQNFQATLQDDGSVHMTWAWFNTPSEHNFVYWKVMRSQTNDNPVYKVDPYIKYDSNINFTWYTDKYPKAGTNYYRVCAITKASDGYHRYCSKNVVKVVKENNYTEPKPTTTTTTTTQPKPVVYTTLTESQKTTIEAIFDKFLEKLDDKYNDVDNKVDVLEWIKEKLLPLAVNPIFAYLNELIVNHLTMLEVEALLDI